MQQRTVFWHEHVHRQKLTWPSGYICFKIQSNLSRVVVVVQFGRQRCLPVFVGLACPAACGDHAQVAGILGINFVG